MLLKIWRLITLIFVALFMGLGTCKQISYRLYRNNCHIPLRQRLRPLPLLLERF